MFNKRLVSLLLAVTVVCGASWAQNYAKRARDFFKAKTGRTLSLSVGQETENCVMLKNDIRGCFVLMCKQEFDSILASPVLAYSGESSTSFSDGSHADMKIMKYYDRVLTEIKEKGAAYRDVLGMQGKVSPLISPLCLSQQKVDLSIVGMQGTVLAGCVPIAATQLMYYYSWPEQAEGSFAYYRSEDVSGVVKMDGINFSWPETLELSKDRHFVIPKPFIALNGMLFDANFGESGTTANLKKSKRPFINHYRYSRKMCFDWVHDDSLLLSTVKSELEASRPVILARWQHAFVCDGYEDGYLHFNMGWGGYFNGFFRIFPDMGHSGEDDFFDILCGITPEKNTKFTGKSVSLTEPGTLASHITDEDFNTLDSLCVEGLINGKDIALLRQLAGAAGVDVPFEKRGVLRVLDLGKATIVAAKDEYYVQRGIVMTHKEWADCHEYNNCYVEEVVPDKQYSYHYFTNKQTVGYFMFQDCDNLETLVIPSDTKKIMFEAFRYCTSLRRFVVPSSVTTYSTRLFEHCMMLETVSVPKDGMGISPNYKNPESDMYWGRNGYPYMQIVEY